MRHLTYSVRAHSRSKNQTFRRRACYILRTRGQDCDTDSTYDYSPKHADVDDHGIANYSGTVGSLGKVVSRAEHRKNSVECRELIVALPHEIDRVGRRKLVIEHVQLIIARLGVAALWAIHRPNTEGDNRNWHAHILFTTREVQGDEIGSKTRDLDRWDTGAILIAALREGWTYEMNQALLALGVSADCEHRSFNKLGIARAPSQHRGERRTACDRRMRARSLPPLPQLAPVVAGKPTTAGHYCPPQLPLPTPTIEPHFGPDLPPLSWPTPRHPSDHGPSR